MAVTVVVEDREATAILDPGNPVDEGDVRERAIPVVAEEYLAFVAVEAVLADVDEGACASVEASTDAFEHVHSDVVEDGARDETVHDVDVEEPVVVVVERAVPELVADVEIGPAVVVVVAPRAGEAPAEVTHAGTAGRVGECAIAIVVEKRVRDSVACFVVRPGCRLLVVPHADDVDVEEPIAVVVGDDRHARPDARGDTGGCRDVDEVTAAEVVKEAVSSPHSGDVEVRPAVVVVVEEDSATSNGGIGMR